jgi:hypothetical protein
MVTCPNLQNVRVNRVGVVLTLESEVVKMLEKAEWELQNGGGVLNIVMG